MVLLIIHGVAQRGLIQVGGPASSLLIGSGLWPISNSDLGVDLAGEMLAIHLIKLFVGPITLGLLFGDHLKLLLSQEHLVWDVDRPVNVYNGLTFFILANFHIPEKVGPSLIERDTALMHLLVESISNDLGKVLLLQFLQVVLNLNS
jgi:hypothetical protein